MKKNILIVGGTGFLGYNLAKKLSKRSYNITIISLSKPKKIRQIPNAEYLICDIGKKKEVEKKLKNKVFQFIFNFGGYVDHSNIPKTYASQYIGVKNLSNFFLKKKIELFVQIGSSLEYGKIKSPQKEFIKSLPISNYAKSKYLATQYLLKLYLKSGFPIVILRCYQIYGPKQDTNRLIPFVIQNCLENKNFNCSAGNQFRDFLYIDDFIKLLKIMIVNKKKIIGQIYNVGFGKSFKVKKLIYLIKNKIKKGKPIFGKIKLRFEESKNLYPNITKVKKTLNWKPSINIKSGIDKTINFYKTKI